MMMSRQYWSDEAALRVALLSSTQRLRWVGVLGLVLCAALLWAPGAGAAPLSTPPDCSSSFNVYDYTPAALAPCGIETYPITSITTLPGGGSNYAYASMNGVIPHAVVPPQGFDPLTASSVQLQEYDYPPRPSDPSQESFWEQLVTATRTPPEPFLAEIPTSADPGEPAGDDPADSGGTEFFNWSGYGEQSSDGAFASSGAEYYEPHYDDATCSSAEAVIWGGVGGWDKGDPLAQEGTAHNVPNLADHQAWWEVDPPNGSGRIAPLDYTTNVGDHIFDYTLYGYPAAGDYDLSVDDITTGQDTTKYYQVPSYDYSGDSVEAIMERPTSEPSGSLTALSNFGTMSFLASYANYDPFTGTPATYFNQLSGIESITMVNEYHDTLATPGAIGQYGAFQDTWDHC
jgi:hypothetical protein